ncbi:MAG: YkgJ family cysteine cluster protein [Nitrospiraceae bacterium]|nr:YkgJ family cysteine cluster protein [Nitrospiraceae bacterium]
MHKKIKALKTIDDFYNELDIFVKKLHEIHRQRLSCKYGCSSCCMDDITVFEIEAENIKSNYKYLLKSGKPYPEGKCAFLDEKEGCRIYEHRPYVCRTQGLPLRWIDYGDNDEFVEMRDICSLNEKRINLEELKEDECWNIGPFEKKMAELQQALSCGQEMKRAALRSLFIKKD